MKDLNPQIDQVTQAIIERSKPTRDAYLERMQNAEGRVNRAKLSCGNIAHACAAESKDDKQRYTRSDAPNFGIVTAYNDMLSAHQPFATYPDLIKAAANKVGATAQVAGGVPAMCDGVTQGQDGMELSLFSRDVIAMSAAVALSHQCFDGAIYLGVCDKIIPGLMIATASFGHLPTIMLPAGPMPSGLPNEQKAAVRQEYAAGKTGKDQLLATEMGSYHSPGTCTFYGTANTNQLIMEIMGLHLPGASFVNPNTPLREALTTYGVERLAKLVYGGEHFTPAYAILSELNFVNGLVGLLASGGSTNLVIHIIAMARGAGVILTLEDLSALSSVVPLIMRVYPNGVADINGFQAAGGMPVFINELLSEGLLHNDVNSVTGNQLSDYLTTPILNKKNQLEWEQQELKSSAYEILATIDKPHSNTSGLVMLNGNLGKAIIKTSALKTEQLSISAPCKIFHDQHAVKVAYEAGELDCDIVCVVRFQGPQANGMPELHGLTPILSNLQAKGYKIALVTDGRMSGASGKVPAAIHVSPEANAGGVISQLQEGDIITIDAHQGILQADVANLNEREKVTADLDHYHSGCGRELFNGFRQHVGNAAEGACVLFEREDS
jgi:phosphogluconate dehydratase